jgi:phosphatidylglycerol lysyltransferase
MTIERTVDDLDPPGRLGLLRRHRATITAVAAFLVVSLAVFALSRILEEVSYDDLVGAIEDTSWTQVALALMFTAGSFLALSVYDVEALRFAGSKLPYPLVALASFCAYSVGNIAGFGPLTGGAVRYRFYSPLGLNTEAIAKVVAYVAAAFGIGLAAIGGVGLLLADNELAHLVHLPPFAVKIVAASVLVAIGALITVSAVAPRPFVVFGHDVSLPEPREIIVQLLATGADVVCAAAVLWILLPPGIDFPAMLAVYAVAIGIGVLSHVPGGAGVFETIMVGALGSRVPLEGIISALVLYRIIYFVVPLIVAVIVLIIGETRRVTTANPALGRAIGSIVPTALGTLTIVLGAMLVFSGVTPAPDDNLDLLDRLLPLPLVESAHFVGSVIGVFLMVIGRGLVHRLDGARWMAMVLVALSIPLALFKSAAIGEALLLAILLVALIFSRRLFARRASLFADSLAPSWWLSIGVILALALGVLFFVYKEVPYSHDLWWEFEITATAPRSLRAAFGIALAAAAIATWLLMRPPTGRVPPPEPADIARAVAIVGRETSPEGNLVRMGDKSLMFSDDGDAFLMYAKRGRSWIALYDPVGPEPSRTELVWRFAETAREHGGRAVFYQASAENLSTYIDVGLTAFKLGEEAVVDLSVFDLKGTRKGNLRNAVNKAEREGIVFEILPVEALPTVYDELADVSRQWLELRNAREKTFSLGAFERDYVLSQPMAVLKRAGRIYAFASLMLTEQRSMASIDLMRFLPTAPNGTMELLFSRMLLHFKAEGYRTFSLGMAPLAGLSDHPVAPLWHMLGRAAYDHGESFYNFHGLRAFKAKFDPDWRPRYMVVAGGLNPLLALADVTFVIGGGLKGVVSK